MKKQLPSKFFIRVSHPQLSAIAQKRLFELGYKWNVGYRKAKYLDSQVIVAYQDGNQKLIGCYDGPSLLDATLRKRSGFRDFVEVSINDIFTNTYIPREVHIRKNTVKNQEIILKDDAVVINGTAVRWALWNKMIAKCQEFQQQK